MPDTTLESRHARALLRRQCAGWLSAVARRRSRRAFDLVPADAWQLEALESLTAEWRPYSDARLVLVAEPDVDVFSGALGTYGKVTGTPHILVFIGDDRADFADQHVGYAGEALILEATRLGLATCWVGGFFSAKKVTRLVELARGERVLAVSPLGYPVARDTATERAMAGLVGASHRKSVADIAPGSALVAWPGWAVAAVETARLAPSATNRQPWRFRFEDGGLVLSKDSLLETPKVAKRLDVGIAMLHVDLAATAHDVDGVWTDLTGIDVARFDPVAAAF